MSSNYARALIFCCAVIFCVVAMVAVNEVEQQKIDHILETQAPLHKLATFKEKVMQPILDDIEFGTFRPLEFQDAYSNILEKVTHEFAPVRWTLVYGIDPDDAAAPLSMHFKSGDDWVEGILYLPVFFEVYKRRPISDFEVCCVQAMTAGLHASMEYFKKEE